jgi:polysaccharide biosynthesis protein PslG
MKRLILIVSIFIWYSVFVTSSAFSEGASEFVTRETPTSQGSDIYQKIGPLNQVCAGVNIHFTTGKEKDLDMIAAGGLKFIRMDFVWQDIESVKGIYNWEAYDELTANLEKRGIRAIYILDYSNSLYEDPVDSKDPLTGQKQIDIGSPQHPESIAAFARWATASVEHFKESNIIWELWNEPNVSFWRPEPDIAQYIELAITTCKAVKSVVPNAVIIGPATSQIPFPFLETFLSSGIMEYLDGVSIHPYRDYSLSPETAVTDYEKLRGMIEGYSPEGRKNIPIISSEWGYASATKGVSLEKQAAYIVRMQLANLLNGVLVSIWYDWKNDGNNPSDFEHNCGTVTSDLKPKPAYIAIQTMNKQLQGFTFLSRINVKNESDFVLLFRNDKGNYKISAWTMDKEHPVIIDKNILKVSDVTITDGYNNDLKPTTNQNRLVLDLNELPQYITLPSGISLK